MNPTKMSLKLLSYNVGGNSHLAGLKVLVDKLKPEIVFIQEVNLDNEKVKAQLGSDYNAESNIDESDVRKPGTSVAWRTNLAVIVTNVVKCRLQIVTLDDISFVNCYANSWVFPFIRKYQGFCFT